MMHLWMTNENEDPIEVNAIIHSNPFIELEMAIKEAQEWADNYRESVQVFAYEGHEDIEDGELIEIIHPAPLPSIQMELIHD